MKTIAAAAVLLGLSITPAFATGGFGCTAEDKSVRYSADAGMSAGMGGQFLNFKGSLELLGEGVPDDLRKIDLTNVLIHHWVDRGDLRLSFYTERTGDKPHAYVDMMMVTKGDDEMIDFKGKYTITVFSMDPPADQEGGLTLNFEGDVTCSVE